MIEFIKHLFGLCGEVHINLITLIMTTPIVGYIIYKFFK